VRYGITNAGGNTEVEMYLTSLNFLVIPNTDFTFSSAKQVLISRKDSMKELQAKFIRILNNNLFEPTLKKVRIWKASSNNIKEILALDEKLKSLTKVPYDGLLLDN